jgi:leucyl-tRNA synthetase
MRNMSKYLPRDFETKIREMWEQEDVYRASNPQNPENKAYCLSMFPYPSGAGLHVGHVRIYTGTDVLARYMRLQGMDVLHPMGWDAFGLPAENAAIKAQKNPMDMVPGNIANFKRQMKSLGLSYDWSREFATTDPSYYRFTQWLFIQFFKMGLLYKKNTPINFCPSCKTGLAEEEVLANGTHERCGKPITKKDLPQWIFRITTYAERLLADLKDLDWPDGILEMQKNWIGKKTGINITYKVTDFTGNAFIDEVTCFTTRPDTNFGATFIVLAPEHPFVAKILQGTLGTAPSKLNEIKAYVDKAASTSSMEREAQGRKKTGVFTGFYAINSLNGKKMPVWVSDFVLMNFGTGAVVGVPAHDMRDFEFAKAYDIEIIRVVKGKDNDEAPITEKSQVQEEEGAMVNSSFLDGMDIHKATEAIMDYMEQKGYGKRVSTYHLRDWIFSRQRYWGEPIPMVYCQTCADKGLSYWDTEEGKSFQKKYQTISKVDQTIQDEMKGWFPLSDEKLPLTLPHVKSYEPTSSGQSPLSQIEEFKNTTCPHCGTPAIRETDTMPNWAGSCWYFLKFASPTTDNQSNVPWKQDDMAKWMPVDWYLGGAEHAVLHLLYARFWVKALQDLGLLNFPEPFLRLRNVGMVLAEDHRKMSKSFGNVINPDDVIAEYGADTLRIYEMFMAPFNMEISWSVKALQGAFRFLNRIWQLYHNSDKINGREDDKEVRALLIQLQKTVRKVGSDIGLTKFNTAIAAMMEFLNHWEKGSVALPHQEAKKFLQILSPFAPFMAEKLWREIYKETKSIVVSRWPDVLVEQQDNVEIKIPVTVNGKMRAVITVPSQMSKEEVESKALQEDKIKKILDGGIFKSIYVPGKILNIVTEK